MPVRSGKIVCDGIGCPEAHPIEHDCLGEPSFGVGRWLGWLYVDMNRPDLYPDTLRFCGVGCLEDWLWRQRRNPRPAPTALDVALRGGDQLAVRAALKEERRATAEG